MLPNSMAPALIQASVTIGFAILLTAGLSFVGAGVRPPTPEWGLMISHGANQLILGEWWTSVFPGHRDLDHGVRLRGRRQRAGAKNGSASIMAGEVILSARG